MLRTKAGNHLSGQKDGMYSPTSVANILKKAALKAKIKKTITPHKLHHSFATHLLEEHSFAN